MGNVNYGIPQKLALGLAQICGTRLFIETGTFEGKTALWAMQHFDVVCTIEGDRDRFWRFLGQATQLHDARLKPYFGPSQEMLWQVIDADPSPALFWLDAHWTGHADHPPVEGVECPLIEELRVVNRRVRVPNHIIMIDDANFFTHQGRIVNYRAWPTLDEVMTELLELDRYIFIHSDVICAVPIRFKNEVRDWVVANG